MENGHIIKLTRDKGFGFLRGDNGVEYFFHKSGALTPFETLNEGQQVRFEPRSTDKGPRAEQVSLA